MTCRIARTSECHAYKSLASMLCMRLGESGGARDLQNVATASM